MPTITVLYEDNHVIAVFKPAGVLAQPTRKATAWQSRADFSMLDAVKVYLKEKYKKPSSAFVGLLHRLDRPVSGIMLFAKTSKGASRLSEQFRNRQVDKTYHALVAGKPARSKGILINNLGKDRKTLKAGNYTDGKEAKLYYEVIASNNKYSLLKVKIEGGKFHQIRAQLSMTGLPIVGDVKYKGERWDNEKAIALCATGLSFKKATEEEVVTLTIEVPQEWEKYIGF